MRPLALALALAASASASDLRTRRDVCVRFLGAAGASVPKSLTPLGYTGPKEREALASVAIAEVYAKLLGADVANPFHYAERYPPYPRWREFLGRHGGLGLALASEDAADALPRLRTVGAVYLERERLIAVQRDWYEGNPNLTVLGLMAYAVVGVHWDREGDAIPLPRALSRRDDGRHLARLFYQTATMHFVTAEAYRYLTEGEYRFGELRFDHLDRLAAATPGELFRAVVKGLQSAATAKDVPEAAWKALWQTPLPRNWGLPALPDLR